MAHSFGSVSEHSPRSPRSQSQALLARSWLSPGVQNRPDQQVQRALAALEARGKEKKAKLKVWVVAGHHFPPADRSCGLCWSRSEVCVRIVEVEPGRTWVPGEEMPMPATWIFGDGYWDRDGGASFPEELTSRYVEVSPSKGWRLRFEVTYSQDHSAPVVGFAEIDIADLSRRENWRLLLSDADTANPVYGADLKDGDKKCVRPPSFLQLRTDCCGEVAPKGSFASQGLVAPKTMFFPVRATRSSVKRVMIMTRGARGDVQPYAALALGLIEFCSCEVTLVTELRWKAYINSWRRQLPEGLQDMLHFRPSGGDTMRLVNSDLAAYTLNLGHRLEIQRDPFLEMSFVSSEGCFFHWAKEEDPDYIIFASTVTHMAMIISEALNIPLVGFFLQPNRDPERQNTTDNRLDSGSGSLDAALEPLRQALQSEKFNAYVMQLLQMMPEKGLTLDELRFSRGLKPLPAGIHDDFPQYAELTKQGIPQIVPISPVVLGDKRANWMASRGMQLTDFIFLRQEHSTLRSDVKSFIEKARESHNFIVGMTMSAMPVGISRMLNIAVAVCQECKALPSSNGRLCKPVVLISLGGQTLDPPDEALQNIVSQLESDHRLHIVNDAALDFTVVLPQLDAVILDGSLGIVSEAIIAGIPIIISGILLFEQRFWANIVMDLGCGPDGCFIDSLLDEGEDGRRNVVSLVECALQTGGDDVEAGAISWSTQAKNIKMAVEAARGPENAENGVSQNSWVVHHAGLQAKVIRKAYSNAGGNLQCLFTCLRAVRGCAMACGLFSFIDGSLRKAATYCRRRQQEVELFDRVASVKSTRTTSDNLGAAAGPMMQAVRSVQVQRSDLLSVPLAAWTPKRKKTSELALEVEQALRDPNDGKDPYSW